MRQTDGRIIAGGILIGLGVLFFVQSLAGADFIGLGGLWGVIFGIAGFGFLYVYLRDRSQWWAVIPALPLLGLAALLLLGDVAPGVRDVFGGALFLGSISLAFWIVYWIRRDFWWAIIPGGVVATLAVIALLSNILPGGETGSVLFLGIGLTFLILYFLPSDRGHQPWAIIPGGILVVFAGLIGLAFGAASRFLWPLLLIAAGAFLVFRSMRSSPG